MPLLSDYARRRKIKWFFDPVPVSAHILEVGSGLGWVGEYLRERGCMNYTSIDLVPPADFVGDVRNWRQLGLGEGSFDMVVAFEVVEHVDCWQACYDLLKPGGSLLVTTPLPQSDWIMKLLEAVGLNQARTSPHDNLTDLQQIDLFAHKKVIVVARLAQWAVFTK